MNYSKLQLWERFQKYYKEFPSIGLALDLSRLEFDDGDLAQMEVRMQNAFDEMDALEAGAIANVDENRMVGHYWLRNPRLAPTPEIRGEIEATHAKIQKFVRDVHSGNIRGQEGVFKNLLIIGIGGSALGPQFVAHALGYPRQDKLIPYFIDNTDPDGIQRVLVAIGEGLGKTLCVIISKSGKTNETRNGMLEVKAAYERNNLNFEAHAIAITQDGSALSEEARKGKWQGVFPMWDWVGGRTSELSAVGLVPAALQGFDITQMLSGAKLCDEVTRNRDIWMNPSALLAIAWYLVGGGQGEKNMIVIPYKDRLELLPRYLQQLVMESLGKECDRDGAVVHQGITVLGNKGSTDQHSYIQQLRDGRNDFFATFLEVLADGQTSLLMVERNTTSADYLSGLFLGTRQALSERSRESITLSIQEVSPMTIGMLIALFERAVGLYASLININAYHQPGVEAGKRAAEAVIKIQLEVLDLLSSRNGFPMTSFEIAQAIGKPEEVEHVFRICERLVANPYRRLGRRREPSPFANQYFASCE